MQAANVYPGPVQLSQYAVSAARVNQEAGLAVVNNKACVVDMLHQGISCAQHRDTFHCFLLFR